MSCHIGIDNGRIQYNTLSPIPNRQHTVNCGWPHPYNRLKQWTNQDHPRACGANCWLIQSHTALNGSSPRMRGKLDVRTVEQFMERIIPAHAGQTRRPHRRTVHGTDHPRACGANHPIDSLNGIYAGSSPRMRGKRLCGSLTPGLVRIIPAHAGQTIPRCAPSTPGPDHPRACGANQRYDNGGSFEHGSSPRMRGKRCWQSIGWRRRRIIPAHAGQTFLSSAPHRATPDHPRACGANTSATTIATGVGGSSPRMRGKPEAWHEVVEAVRIIPAHAGQTRVYAVPLIACSDHPRACGANELDENSNVFASGSSPRMRGKQRGTRLPRRAERIIPAHAGQTAQSSAKRPCRSDHPRACGANLIPMVSRLSGCGSSPRMRGKQLDNEGILVCGRIIPAHAGQTRA